MKIHPGLSIYRIIISGEQKMKTITPLSILVLIMFLATACGSPTPAATQAPTQPPTTESPATEPAATQANPTEVGAVTSSTQVDITLADNTIESSVTTFQVGVPYTFVITNTGRRAHNFNINPPVSVVGSLNAALDNALLVVKQEQLGAGTTATVEYTFAESAVGQTLEFSCLIRQHYEDEMFLPITVTN
jgi:uncharacterized cupredoxin-like copper-binding protein